MFIIIYCQSFIDKNKSRHSEVSKTLNEVKVVASTVDSIGRWFVISVYGPSGANVNATKPIHWVTHQLGSEASDLWLREFCKKEMTQNDDDKTSSNSSDLDSEAGFYSESDFVTFEKTLALNYRSSVEDFLIRRARVILNTTDK